MCTLRVSEASCALGQDWTDSLGAQTESHRSERALARDQAREEKSRPRLEPRVLQNKPPLGEISPLAFQGSLWHLLGPLLWASPGFCYEVRESLLSLAPGSSPAQRPLVGKCELPIPPRRLPPSCLGRGGGAPRL